jgi:hypothetical protein
MGMGGLMAPSGTLQVRRIGADGIVEYCDERAPLRWRVRNAMRWSFVWGWFCNWLAKQFTKLTQIPTLTAELSIRVRKLDGRWVDYGVVSRRVVTDAGVAYIVDDLDNASGGADISLFNYHGCGTGVTAENANQTALVTESTTALNPDSTRATGTRSQPSANVFRSVGTPVFDGAAAITEHGLFTQAATGGGTMLDRSVFSAVNVIGGESIQFQYDFSVTSGS